MTFAVGCNSATGYLFSYPSGRTAPDSWIKELAYTMQISPQAKPTIPASSKVDSNRKILARNDLTLTVTDITTGAPIAGTSASIQSSRISGDTITQPANTTDASGIAKASVETRDQTTTSTITSASSDIKTTAPAILTWLPAHYEENFLVTCYVISNEMDFVNTRLVSNVPKLPAANTYRQGFLNDVRLQGSGQSISGDIIHYDGGGNYSIQPCALTATNVCAVDGTTIAADFTVIPRRGTVVIDSVGSRVAQDTGGHIKGHHIDVYYGSRRTACDIAGHQNLGVDFSSY